ncbi:MAG: O-acetylhomoserine aminocarboxypropyltransferase/cysteine synthase [Oscillospiraceae bacterium]|nr:O-acetylhomoserine aminocarboxypropyltransferase/cysteine synthase [Oscillospiraceae bacterium]
MENYGFNTIAVHGGNPGDKGTGSIGLPIHLTNAYRFENTEHAKNLFELSKFGNIYSRIMNPTSDAFEQRMAQLEGGVGALAFSSGHAAIFNTIVNLANAGDEIVSSLYIYGGAINLLGTTLSRLGITVKFVNPDDLGAWEEAITDKTRGFFVETIGNPNANVADLQPIADLAHKHGIPFVVDSTFTTPYLCRPIEFGADFVVHSATKYISSYGGVMGGAVIDSGRFEFKDNPRFPLYNQPDPSYHGIIYADLGAPAFILRMRTLLMRDIGACLSPFNSHQLCTGLETLPLRMDRHSQNALKVAEYLENHSAVSAVNYPGLKSSRYNGLVNKYFKDGMASSVFTFVLAGGKQAGADFIDSLKLIVHCANVGDAKSLVSHPATTTHSQLTPERLLKAGITDGTVRLSIGIEDVNDIIADLEQAIK